jgi:SAM-dependent methyltransferase
MSEIPAKNVGQDRDSILAFAASEESGSQHREDLLKDFAHDPQGEAVWQRAYDLAQQEEQAGEGLYSEFQEISTSDLINISEKVRSLHDFRDRYRAMTALAPNGRIWFEELTGFSSPDVECGVTTYLISGLGKIEAAKFDTGVDLGCGTGRVSEILAEYCEHTIGVDASEAMLDVARQRSGDKISYQDGEVSKLPLEDNSVDIITAIGVIGALDAQQEIGIFTEAARVLKDGGVLIDGYYGNTIQNALITLSWKNTLADMIVDTVSGKYEDKRRLNVYEEQDLKRSCGLATTNYRYGWIPEVTVIAYEKDAKKLSEQYRGYSVNSSIY